MGYHTDAYYRGADRRQRSGTAFKNQFGGYEPGEFSGIDSEGRGIPLGMRPREQGLHSGGLDQAPAGPTAFDQKFSRTTAPTRQVTTPAVPAPVIGAAAGGAAGVNALTPGAVTPPVAGAATPAHTTTQAAPDAFGAQRKTSTGGTEVWQRSEVAANGGRWVPTTMGLHANGQLAANATPIHANTGASGAPAAQPGPQQVATAPNAVRTVAIDPRYQTPGMPTTGSLTAGGSTGPGGRVFDERGDRTASTDAYAGYPARAAGRPVLAARDGAANGIAAGARAAMPVAPATGQPVMASTGGGWVGAQGAPESPAPAPAPAAAPPRPNLLAAIPGNIASAAGSMAAGGVNMAGQAAAGAGTAAANAAGLAQRAGATAGAAAANYLATPIAPTDPGSQMMEGARQGINAVGHHLATAAQGTTNTGEIITNALNPFHSAPAPAAPTGPTPGFVARAQAPVAPDAYTGQPAGFVQRAHENAAVDAAPSWNETTSPGSGALSIRSGVNPNANGLDRVINPPAPRPTAGAYASDPDEEARRRRQLLAL